MQLIKIDQNHYIIIDNSEIKECDWIYNPEKEPVILQHIGQDDVRNWKKIIYSTQPLGDNKDTRYFPNQPYYKKDGRLSLSEVKELLGEVDLERMSKEFYSNPERNVYQNIGNILKIIGFKDGYNQALEDNKNKKYTEDDILKVIKLVREGWCLKHEIFQELQPKTEWEVDIIDGKVNLK